MAPPSESLRPSASAHGARRSASSVPVSGAYTHPRPEWLARLTESAIDPGRPIIDAHHHLWDRADARYMFDDLLSDLETGHNIVATIYVDCRSMYRVDGPDVMRPLGEVEFANGVAAMSASGGYGSARVCDGIVGHADLRFGADAKRLLEAQIAAGGGRFKGIRQVSAWTSDASVSPPMPNRPKELLLDRGFREGFACLAPLGLSFDAYLYHPQLEELLDLARAFPDTPIMLDHVGAPIGIGSYANRRDEVFAEWSRSVRELARLPHVWVKLGGLGMRLAGFGFHERPDPPGSEELAAAWRPYVETCIEAFGSDRSMFESNFPPDKGTCGYGVLWNAFKRLAAECSEEEKNDLFFRSAHRFYRLDPGLVAPA